MSRILLILLLISNFTIGQSNERISKINQEISSALENEDYERAEILKKQKDLAIELNELVDNNAFDKAAVNKEKIDDIDRYLKIDNLIKQAVEEEKFLEAENLAEEKHTLYEMIQGDWEINEEVVPDPPEKIEVEKESEPVSANKSEEYDFFGVKPGGKKAYGAIDLTTGLGIIDFDEASVFISLKWGLKWYSKNSADSKTRIGFQLNHLQASGFLLLESFNIAPLNVGFSVVRRFSKRVGFEFNLTGGFNTFADYGDWSIGFRGNPELKMRFAVFTVGLDSAYMYSFDVGHYITSGVSIGICL